MFQKRSVSFSYDPPPGMGHNNANSSFGTSAQHATPSIQEFLCCFSTSRLSREFENALKQRISIVQPQLPPVRKELHKKQEERSPRWARVRGSLGRDACGAGKLTSRTYRHTMRAQCADDSRISGERLGGALRRVNGYSVLLWILEDCEWGTLERLEDLWHGGAGNFWKIRKKKVCRWLNRIIWSKDLKFLE